MMLNLDKLKDKIESKISATIDKKEDIQELGENNTIKGKSSAHSGKSLKN
ncbi:unnamed protein product [marine sediment metagenome]|uniref:Uncharacterized protein n=1 Tax=marine sediment metagenome TaxID=412755 RepID=X1A4S9_9ZZZZ